MWRDANKEEEGGVVLLSGTSAAAPRASLGSTGGGERGFCQAMEGLQWGGERGAGVKHNDFERGRLCPCCCRCNIAFLRCIFLRGGTQQSTLVGRGGGEGRYKR